MVLAHIADVLPAVLSPKRVMPRTLDDLVQHFEWLEADERPDIDVPMRALRLTPEGLLEVPERRETFAFTDWSRRQLASLLGVRWETWFDPERISGEDRASEVNRRLQASGATFRLRSLQTTPDGVDATGTLRALVSPRFTPILDSTVTRLLRSALEAAGEETFVVSRLDVTDRTVSYAVRIGAPFDSGSGEVGSLSGAVHFCNSHVGFRSAALYAAIERLVCRNGMRLPAIDPVIFRKSHRSFDAGKLATVLLRGLMPLQKAFQRSARVLVEARRARVSDATAVFRQLLEAARVPLSFLSEVERAYAAEPDLEPSAFAVSQAITRAAQHAEPSARDELERVAGVYLANLYRDVE